MANKRIHSWERMQTAILQQFCCVKAIEIAEEAW